MNTIKDDKKKWIILGCIYEHIFIELVEEGQHIMNILDKTRIRNYKTRR